MKNSSKFQKGSGCYTCKVCNKLTRGNGKGYHESFQMCERCFLIEEGENAVADGNMTRKEFKAKFGQDPTV